MIGFGLMMERAHSNDDDEHMIKQANLLSQVTEQSTIDYYHWLSAELFSEHFESKYRLPEAHFA